MHSKTGVVDSPTLRLNDSVILSLFALFGVGSIWLGYQVFELKKAIELRPLTLVVDPAQLALKNVPMDDPLGLDHQFAALQKTIDNYRSQGYIIVNSTNVLAAPEEIYITQEEVNAESNRLDSPGDEWVRPVSPKYLHQK